MEIETQECQESKVRRARNWVEQFKYYNLEQVVSLITGSQILHDSTPTPSPDFEPIYSSTISPSLISLLFLCCVPSPFPMAVPLPLPSFTITAPFQDRNYQPPTTSHPLTPLPSSSSTTHHSASFAFSTSPQSSCALASAIHASLQSQPCPLFVNIDRSP